MYKARILLILAIWLALLPYLGFPYSWKGTLTTLTGLVLIYLSYELYKDYKKIENKEKIFDNFSENKDFSKKESEQSNYEDDTQAVAEVEIDIVQEI